MDKIIVFNEDTGELSIPEKIIEAIRANEVALKEAKKQNEEFKAKLLEAMEEYGVEKISSDVLTVSYVAGHESIRTDTTRLKEEYPEAYWGTLKESPVKASVRVRLK